MATILPQVGQFYFGGVGQYYFGVNNWSHRKRSTATGQAVAVEVPSPDASRSRADARACLKDTGDLGETGGRAMSDWDFLHEMRDRGYSAEEMQLAAGVGYAPWEETCLSREWINDELEDESPDCAESLARQEQFRSREGFPYSILEQIEIFEDLVDCADRHFKNTGRYLQVWGELGEIYAEIKFGLRRHRSHEAGSDGIIAAKLVEVKTISPEKGNDHVLVKSQGKFEQLLIVRIDENFQFTGKLIDRGKLNNQGGKYLKARMQGADG